MQKIVIVANGAAYGSESLFNSLRLAIALRERESNRATSLFNVGCRHRRAEGAKTRRRVQYSANAGDPDCAKCTGQTV